MVLWLISDNNTVVRLDDIVLELVVRLFVNHHFDHACFAGAMIQQTLLVKLAAPVDEEVTHGIGGFFWGLDVNVAICIGGIED